MAIGTRFPTFVEVGTTAAIALATAGTAAFYIEGEQRVTGVLSGSGTLLMESGAYFDGSTFVIDANANRVGIINTAPKTALDVVGTISGTTLVTQTLSGVTLRLRSATNAQGALCYQTGGRIGLCTNQPNAQGDCVCSNP